MVVRRLPWSLLLLIISGSALYLLFSSPRRVLSLATHVVISQVQISGDGADSSNDEFVELYNPTNSPIVMDSWRLTRKNSTGVQANLVSDLSGTIPSRGYFLIGHATGYNGSLPLDEVYSAPSNALTNNYAVLLYSDAGITLVDKVGFGTGVDFETVATGNPSTNSSIVRKANSSSTDVTMGTGGMDEFGGNGEDSDNNSLDFVTFTTSIPRNSDSPIAPADTPTPTPSLTPTITPTEEPTPTVTPTVTPTPTVEPTPTPTTTPTITSVPTQEPARFTRPRLPLFRFPFSFMSF